MIKEYYFSGDGTILFDDRKSVRELISAAFEKFDYFEPLGMKYVTVFQAHHPDAFNGRFTLDTSKSCAEEIKCPDCLCFAYHIPNVLYYAEGGWGRNLGNAPTLDKKRISTFALRTSTTTLLSTAVLPSVRSSGFSKRRNTYLPTPTDFLSDR